MNAALRIAIIVHGRFHGFDLARELIRLGHDVTVFTNYPSFIGPRFGIPASSMKTLVTHGVLARAWSAVAGRAFQESADRILHTSFGRWAARHVVPGKFDVFHCFSGVAEELLAMGPQRSLLRTIVRGSAHIGAQLALLQQEEQRIGHPVEKPSAWMVARELREYAAADLIFVLSRFAYRSFVEAGVPEARLRLLPLGTQVDAFQAAPEAAARRAQRIRAGEPLRILYVGTFCARKGAADFAGVAKRLSGSMKFRVVGPVDEDARRIAAQLDGHVEFRGKVPHYDLPHEYDWGDVFYFPTIEDGFATVLAQAQAAGLPVLASANSGAPDLVKEGISGWLIPIRAADAAIKRLTWCHAQRDALAVMTEAVPGCSPPRDWASVAADFVRIVSSERSAA